MSEFVDLTICFDSSALFNEAINIVTNTISNTINFIAICRYDSVDDDDNDGGDVDEDVVVDDDDDDAKNGSSTADI
jgi:hypothetical protein